MKGKKFLCIFLITVLCLSLVQNTRLVYAYGMASEKTFVIYSGGSFTGTNAQSGAINMYVTTLRLLSDDAKVYVQFKDKSGEVKNEFYWIANSENQEDDGNRYSVSKSFLHTVYANGESISFKVVSGSMSLQWPDGEKTMPYSYSKGNSSSSEEVEDEIQSDEEMQAIVDQLGLDQFFKDGKFIMYTAKIADEFVLENDEVPAIGNFFENISPGGFCVKDNGSTFAVSATYTEEENIVWRFAFPADFSEEEEKSSLEKVLYDAKAWNEYKDKIELMSQTLDDINSLSEDVKDKKYADYLPDIAVYVGNTKVIENDKIPGIKKFEDEDEILNKKIKVGDYFSGYFEITTDRNFNYISSSGKVVGDFGADGKHYIRQYFSPIGNITVPWFWSINYDFDGYTQLELNCSQDENGKKVMNKTGTVKANGKMAGQAGAGIYGVVNVAGNLQGNITAEMVPRMYLSADGEIYLSARFFNYYKRNIVGPYKYNHVFWDYEKEDLLDNYLSAQACKNDDMCLVSRDFLNKSTVWNGDESSQNDSGMLEERLITYTSADESEKDFSVKGTEVTGSYLQKWTMEGSAPQIVRLGDKEVMIFLTMTKEGEAGNAGRLMYSVKTDGKWSEPAAVWDNGNTDYFADAKVVGDSLYLTWQKSSEGVAGTDVESQMQDAISKSEICVAQFDSATDSFIGQQYVTENDYVDMLPQVIGNSSVPAIAWISNTKNSIDAIQEPNTIVYSIFKDGVWSEGKMLTDAEGYIGNYEVYQNDKEYDVVYSSIDLSQYEENEALTSTLYYANKEETKILEEGKESVIGLQYCDGSLYWLSDNVLEQFDCQSETIKALINVEEAKEQKNVGADFIVAAENGKKSVVWSAAEENGYAMYSSLIGMDGISNRIKLYEREGAGLQSFKVALQPDGTYDFLMDELIDSEENQYALSEIIKKETDALSFGMVDMTDLNRNKDNEQSITAVLQNTGETTLDNIHIKVMSGETLYLDTVLPATLAPGERYLFSDSFKVTKIQQLKNFKVYLYGGKQTEQSAQVYETVLGKTNFSLTMEKIEKGGKPVLKCKVTNESDTPSSGVVNLYDDISATNQINSISFDKLAAGESDYLYFVIDSSSLNFDGDNGLAYQAKLETKVPDYQNSNNNAMVMLYASDFASEDNSNKTEEGESETGNTETGKDESETGNTETGKDENETGNTETGKDENETGNTETGKNENETGNTETGKNENETGNTETGKNESETGNTEVGKDESETGNTETGKGETGNTETGKNENETGNTETENSNMKDNNVTTGNGESTNSGGDTSYTPDSGGSASESNLNTEKKTTTGKRPSVSAVSKFNATAGNNKITLMWKKSLGVSGYQIQLSTSKKYKNAKSYNVASSKKKYVIKKLKANKKYYVRIRAYKTYREVTGKRKRVYGPYKKISIKTKRKD